MTKEKLKKNAAPVVRQMAKQDGIDVNQVPGTGKNGAVTKADYEAYKSGNMAPNVILPLAAPELVPTPELPPSSTQSGSVLGQPEPSIANPRSDDEVLEEARAISNQVADAQIPLSDNRPHPVQEEGINSPEQELKEAIHDQRQAYTPRHDERRAPMNHLRAEPELETSVGGMQFRRSRTALDHSYRKTVDIPEKCKHPDLHYRVVTDQKGKLEYARSVGYEKVDNMVDPDTGDTINTRFRMGTKKDGSDLYGYLMAIPKKWYEDRRKQAEQERRAKEDGLFAGPQDETGKPLGNEFYNKGSELRE